MSRISFTILGSAAGLARPDRVNSGYVLDIDDRLVLFDCGGGVSSAFRRAGFDPLAVERIVISHAHADHLCDLPLFIQMQYLLGREAPLTIHLPSELVEPIKFIFRTMYLFPEKLTWLEFVPVPDKAAIEADGLSIRPIANSHQRTPITEKYIQEYGFPNRMQCYSYLITVEGKNILYSADLGSEKDLFDYLKGIDLLVVEAMHIDLAGLLEATAVNKVGRVVLTHLDENFDPHEALMPAKKTGADNLIIASDGQRLAL